MTLPPKARWRNPASGKVYPLSRPKKSRRKQLEKALDEAFSEYIRARDGKCVTPRPGCNPDWLTCSHLFKRRYKGTRWDEECAFCQCAPCNGRHNHDPEHLTAYFLKVVSKKYGAKRVLEIYEEKKAKAHAITKYTIDELEQLLHKGKGEKRW